MKDRYIWRVRWTAPWYRSTTKPRSRMFTRHADASALRWKLRDAGYTVELARAPIGVWEDVPQPAPLGEVEL